MKPVRLLVALVALAALGGGIWYSEKHPPKADADSSAEIKPAVKMVTAKDDQVTKVRIIHADGVTTTVEKDGRGSWSITEPKKYPADETAVHALVTAVTSVEAEQVVADKGTGQWAIYGLDPAKFKVEATLAGGKQIVLSIGNEAPTGSPVYAKLDGDDRVFGVSAALKTSLDKSAGDLRDKRMLRVDPEKVAKVTLENPKDMGANALEFGRNGSEWQIVKPHTAHADNYAVDDLIRAGSSNFDSIISEDESNKDARKHNFAKPWAVLTVVDGSGEHKLTLVEEKSGAEAQKADPSADSGSFLYFAKSTDQPGVYKFQGTSANSLRKPLEGFRNGRIFEMSYSDPDKIEARDVTFQITVDKKTDEKKKEDQWFNAATKKQIPSEKVQSLLSQLRRLNATGYPADTAAAQANYGLDKPTIEVKLTVLGKVQRAVFSVRGSQAYVARDGDPVTYEIPMTDLVDLKKFIGDLK